jgi:peptide deformylase
MAVRELCILPNPVLRRKAKRVSSIDASIRRLVDEMLVTMHEAKGVGLAAPQVGVSLRVVVIQLPEEEPLVLINPQIVKRAGEREITEACLSIPGWAGHIKRSVSVTCKALDKQGREYRIKGTELLAQALEHEIDHLNGVLYIDHLDNEDKLYKVEPKSEDEEEVARA